MGNWCYKPVSPCISGVISPCLSLVFWGSTTPCRTPGTAPGRSAQHGIRTHGIRCLRAEPMMVVVVSLVVETDEHGISE